MSFISQMFLSLMLLSVLDPMVETHPYTGKNYSLLPDYIVTQTGGYVGFTTLGVGYDINKHYQTDIVLGYVPALVGGENLWSLTWKNSMKLKTHYGITPYVGASLLYSFDRSTFVKLPDRYPRKYYPPTGLRVAPYMGLQYKNKKHALFFELTSLDHYLEAYIRSDGALHLKEVVTYGVGYKRFLTEEGE